MKIIVAFDSFKGCMTAQEACHAAACGIHEVCPDAQVIECPLSDGGEGLVACIEGLLDVQRVTVRAHDPLMNPMEAYYVIDPRTGTAYMEMAATGGLILVPAERRNPMLTTTYGVGEMIVDASRRGCKAIVMGIGGSATCDGGEGMIHVIEESGFPRCKIPPITVACDVTNPLFGPEGAAYIFAPQKGATPEQVVLLDKRLRYFADKMEKTGFASVELAHYPGVGAAGGLGYGLMAYLKASLRSGIDTLFDINCFDRLIEDAELIITGEGMSDAQTLMGKVPDGVLRRARKFHIPVWLLSGGVDDVDGRLGENFHLVRSINRGDERPLGILIQPLVAQHNLRNTVKQCIICRAE